MSICSGDAMASERSDLDRDFAEGIGYLRRAGSAKYPLVLLHGIGSNAGSFAAVLDALPQAIVVFDWDAPG